MKGVITMLFLSMAVISNGQSPYLSIKASMKQSAMNYKIEMKLCGLKNGSSFKNILEEIHIGKILQNLIAAI